VAYVLVHGFTQSERSWAGIVDELGDATAARVPDGLDFVATARALGDAHGRATYVGYSMGGRLCLQLALDRPGLVERLVLVSASPGIADPSERAARRARDEQLAQEVERLGVDEFLERWLAQPMFATLPDTARHLDERRAANRVDRLTHQLRALGAGSQPSNWARLSLLTMPVLLVAGELDATYAGLAVTMGELIGAAAEVRIVERAGHALQLERPATFAHLLTCW
jgi:2-succinyl-6-hydroxy-2,4-cyclohexadiene-1-carboxylate synthase